VRLKAEEYLRADKRRAAPLLRQAVRLQFPPRLAVRAAILLYGLEEKEGAEMLRRLAREQHLRNGEGGELLRRAVRQIIGPEFYIRQATAALTRLEQRPESYGVIMRFRQALEILGFLNVTVPGDLLRRALVVRTVGGENLSLVRMVLAGTHDPCLEHVCMARKAAVEAILNQEDPQIAYILLIRNLVHPSPAVELTAMYGLELLGDTRAIGPLMRFARNPDSPVAEDARRLVGILSDGCPDVVMLLRPAPINFVPPEELLRPATHALECDPASLVRPLQEG